MGTTLKIGSLSIGAIALWITGNFGEAFYLLAGLLILDFILNYKDEMKFIQKTGYIFLSTASAFYVQNVSNDHINMAKGIIVVLAVNELGRVAIEIKARIDAYQKSHTGVTPAQVQNADSMIDTITQNVLLKMQSTNISTPGGQAIQPDPVTLQAAFKEGINGE